MVGIVIACRMEENKACRRTAGRPGNWCCGADGPAAGTDSRGTSHLHWSFALADRPLLTATKQGVSCIHSKGTFDGLWHAANGQLWVPSD